MDIYKNETFDHFNDLADDKNRHGKKFKTEEEKKYKQNQKVFHALSQLDKSFDENQVYDIDKSLRSLVEYLSCQKEENSQIIPEENIIQIIEIFDKFQDTPILQLALQLLCILIEMDDELNNNIDILIKNSLVEVIICFSDKIQTIKNQIHITLHYLKVIYSLISYCNRNVNSKASKFIIQAIDFNYIFNLHELIINGNECVANQVEWLECVQAYFNFLKICQTKVDYQIFSNFLHIFKSMLSKKYNDSYLFTEVLNTLTFLINSDLIDQIDQNEFVELDYPNILSEFSMTRDLGDYRLINAAAKCVSACATHDFTEFEYNINDVFTLTLRYKNEKMYQSLFISYSLIASINEKMVDSFFQEDTLEFLNKIQKFKFKLKKEVAIFFAAMIEFAQPNNIEFLVQTQDILIFLYEIYTDSTDPEILSSILECFVKIGPIFLSLYSSEDINQFFSEIVPESFDIDDLDDEIDIQNHEIILNDFPFFFRLDSETDE